MNDSVIITDTEGNFVEFNDAYVTLYRFKAERNASEFFCIHESVRSARPPTENL